MEAEHLGYNSLRASRVHTFNHVTRSRTKHIVKMADIWSDEKRSELSGLWRIGLDVHAHPIPIKTPKPSVYAQPFRQPFSLMSYSSY